MYSNEAGKGSVRRPTDQLKYASNYDLIFGSKTVNPQEVNTELDKADKKDET